MEFVVRPYQEDDRQAIITLWSICGLVVPQNDPHRDIDRKVENDPENFLIGTVSGKLAASCMVGYDGHRGWINYLAIHPNHQRHGFATQIMTEAERILQNAGCPKINLQVRSTNANVISFYKSLGFTDDHVVSLGKRLISDQS